MKKIILLFILIISMAFGCNNDNNNDSENPVSLYKVDINSLNNQDIINVIQDYNLKEGIYKIETNNNNYIFFNGITNEFSDISCKLENKKLIISCNTISSLKNTQKLYVIREKNTASYDNTVILFNDLILNINNKEVPFTHVYSFIK